MRILDFLFPKCCLGCGRFGKYFCDRCREVIKTIATNEARCPMCGKPAIDGVTHPRCQTRYSLDGLISYFHYEGVIRQAVKTLKYRCVSDLAFEFVSLTPAPHASRATSCVLVPIPLHRSRFMERGFNQAEVLGRLVAEQLHIPVCTDILKRVKKTVPQVSMKKREARLANMQGVFAVRYTSVSERVVLFDDVFTTGATMRSAANALKRAGAKYVWAVTMAR